ncbi:MAG TPA: CBS domain-containing protein [Casimicrobiaceae bacterium]|nr:CBS domain-containing protein [Casimicrobiaceae bacterium]
MLVRDRMSARPVTIRSDADYKAALKLMQEYSLHHVPVLDAKKRLVGIVAERDLLLAATHHLQAVVEVGEVMHRNVVTTTRDAPLSEAAALMVDHRIGGLPVLDRKQKVVGVITETDIFRAFVETQRAGDGQKKPARAKARRPGGTG